MRTPEDKGPEGLTRRVASSTWNVNLLCVIGACIGIASLFVVWMYVPPNIPGPPGTHSEPTIIQLIAEPHLHLHPLYYWAAVLFLIGTCASFVSPVDGVVQSSSLVLFAVGIVESRYAEWLDGLDPRQELRLGMCLGLASCSIVLVSLVRPVGTDRLRPGRSEALAPAERLLTVSRSER